MRGPGKLRGARDHRRELYAEGGGAGRKLHGGRLRLHQCLPSLPGGFVPRDIRSFAEIQPGAREYHCPGGVSKGIRKTNA